MSPGDIVDALRDEGIILGLDRLAVFPDKFPESFRSDGPLIGLATDEQEQQEPKSKARESSWWRAPTDTASLALSDIVVLHIETTGLNRDVDEILQIAAVHMGAGESVEFIFDRSDWDGSDRAALLRPALEKLDSLLEAAQAIAGHSLSRFDLPFLEKAAERAGLTWGCGLPELDVHFLSVLVDPTLPDRRLTTLCETFGVTLDEAHQAMSDVRATAELIPALLAHVDNDPSWQLSQRCLASTGNPWAELIPSHELGGELSQLMPTRRDPLVEPLEAQPTTATAAIREGFAALQADSDEFVPRAGQQTMAQFVGSTLEAGGRLAIEAPTGTGKSLAYLIPATGRAHASPVILSTHTKVLQRQLRKDAERLRELGTLRVPFRQLRAFSSTTSSTPGGP